MSMLKTHALSYTKGQHEALVHVQAFSLMAGLMALPLTLNLAHTRTQMYA